jgi:hypothetical protein
VPNYYSQHGSQHISGNNKKRGGGGGRFALNKGNDINTSIQVIDSSIMKSTATSHRVKVRASRSKSPITSELIEKAKGKGYL